MKALIITLFTSMVANESNTNVNAFTSLIHNNSPWKSTSFETRSGGNNNNDRNDLFQLHFSSDDDMIVNNKSIDNDRIPSRRDFFSKYTAIASSACASASILTLRHPQPSYASSLIPTTSSSSTSTSPSSSILCDPSVSIFQHPTKKRTVYLLGTAHISSNSAQAAATLVKEMKPNAVFVELDEKRVGRAIPKPNPETWPSVDGGNSSITVTVSSNNSDDSNKEYDNNIMSSSPPTSSSTLTKNNKINFFDFREMALRKGSEVIGNSIKGLYSKLESEGFNAGEEFVLAVREGLKINAKIILGDRDVEVTLRRLTEALSKTDLKKLLAADSELEENMKQLIPPSSNTNNSSNNNDGDMSAEQLRYFVETVKAKENVRLLMNNLKSVAPEVYQAMVAERDVYMANGIDGLDQFESIVAVMGIAHIDGVENTLKSRGWIEVKPSC